VSSEKTPHDEQPSKVESPPANNESPQQEEEKKSSPVFSK